MRRKRRVINSVHLSLLTTLVFLLNVSYFRGLMYGKDHTWLLLLDIFGVGFLSYTWAEYIHQQSIFSLGSEGRKGWKQK